MGSRSQGSKCTSRTDYKQGKKGGISPNAVTTPRLQTQVLRNLHLCAMQALCVLYDVFLMRHVGTAGLSAVRHADAL